MLIRFTTNLGRSVGYIPPKVMHVVDNLQSV